ncbi:lysophospholipid acyltransferase family protein [Telluribacter sp.]|uniref:lysophospholipid acyltransferase family protein n=1 Tax=Telluribacter sp. TaxID=1978767 RepID=UPI002E1277D2|nr:lysophospholipid acyltransferase family protein [Telluribacter sp.]
MLTTLFISLLNAFSRLSWRNLYRLSDGLSWLLFNLVKYRQQVIWQNLRLSFPDKNDQQLRPIARAFHRHFTDLIVETLKLRQASVQDVQERLVGDISVINDLYARGKSAVFVLGHRGNWELANLFASATFKHECIVVYKPLSNQRFEEWFRQMRTRFGGTMVPMREIYGELLKPRTRPYLLFLVNDQSPNPRSAYWTRFLHQDTGVYRGVEAIARKYDLPVVYADLRRDEERRGYYWLDITPITEEPAVLPVNGVLEKQIRILENDIVKQPGNWLWSHKRWKHRRPARLQPEQILEARYDRE